MKKFIGSLALVMLCGVSVLAQINKTVIVKEEEVPVAVRIALENDFGIKADDGNWKLTYSLSPEGSKTIAQPLWYTYARKSKNEKIQIRYTPTGKLESSKGAEKSSNASTTTGNGNAG